MSAPVWSDWSDEDAYFDRPETKDIKKCENVALLSDREDTDMSFKETISTTKSSVTATSINVEADGVGIDSLNQSNSCKENYSRQAVNAKDNITKEQQSSQSSEDSQTSPVAERDKVTNRDSESAFTTNCENEILLSAMIDNDKNFKGTLSTNEISAISVNIEANSVENDSLKQRNSCEQVKCLSKTVNANDDISQQQQQQLTVSSEDNQTSPAIEQTEVTEDLDTSFIKKSKNGILLSKREENDMNFTETNPTNEIFVISTSVNVEADGVETDSLDQRNKCAEMKCNSETEKANTEEQQSAKSSVDNQPSSITEGNEITKDSQTIRITRNDDEIHLHTQNNVEMNFKENTIKVNNFDKLELSNELTDSPSDSQFVYKKSKSVPALKKACRPILQKALKKKMKRKGSLEITVSAKKSKISGSRKISLNKGGKKHSVGKGRRKMITYASKFPLKKSHTTVISKISKKFKTFDKAIETDVISMKKSSNKAKIRRQRKKKKLSNVKKQSIHKQQTKRLDSESSSLSSEDDLPLSVLRKEHPVMAKHEDSDGSYKPNETDINSTDSDCSSDLPIHGQSKLQRGTETKGKRDNTLKRVPERKIGKKLGGKTGKKKAVSDTKSCSKKQRGQSDADVKEHGVKGTLEITSTSNNVLQITALERTSQEQKCIGMNERNTIISYSELIQKAKEESRKEDEKRKLTEHVHEKRLDQLLFSNGYIRQSVRPDGNCFFEASILGLLEVTDGRQLRQQLCQHLEENVDEYIGFLFSRSSRDTDFAFLKAYFREIDILRQNGYWTNRAGDFLPLALANWSQRTVRIYSSKPEQPVIEIQPTLGSRVETEPICLAYTSSPGISEHYDGCIKCSRDNHILSNETQPLDQVDEGQLPTQNRFQNESGDNGILTAVEISITEADADPNVCSTDIYETVIPGNNANKLTDAIRPEFTAEPLHVQPDNEFPIQKPCKSNAECNSRISNEHICSPKKVTPRKAAKYITPVKRKLVRKRKSTPENWKKSVRKRLRLSGQEYKSSTGKIMEEKKMRPPCKGCRFKCTTMVSEENRKQIFDSFWSLGSYERQKDFVCSSVTEKKTRTYLDDNNKVQEKRRMVSRSFTLESEGQKYSVCKKFFTATLSIGEAYINHALSNKTGGRFHSEEKRGKHKPHNKTCARKLQMVRDHISSFPKVDGHYIRKDSNRQFLGPELNISRMYDLYKEKCIQDSHEPVSKAVYRRTFNEEFNYSFHVPKKDQCNICTRYNQSISDGTVTDEMRTEYEKHQNRKVRARQEKENDKDTAKTTTNTFVATFDLQSVLYTPCTLVSLMYYMRKLCCYNLSVYNVSSQAGTCYVWSETDGGRGSCEVATCLRLQILSLPLNIDHVILYSDACGGQNRNQVIATSLLDAVTAFNNIKIIDHKFLESGHTHMECDSMHAAIEFAKKKTAIYIPSQWDTVIRMARRKNPYTVIPIKHEDIIDFKQMKAQKIKNVRITTEGKKVNWTKIRWMRFKKDIPDTCFIKYEYDEEFQSIKVTGSKRGCGLDVPPNDPRPTRYMSKLPISAAKKKDLLNLCKSGVIPSEFHNFYKCLPSQQSVKDRLPEPDILENNSDSDTDAE